MVRLILASNSPRRRELLQNAGFQFDVRSSGIEETRLPGESSEDFARRLARDKTLDVARESKPGSLVLGADTVVAINGEILEKPVDAADAARMLRALSGRTHRVITGVCLIRAPETVLAWTHETTSVTFKDLTDEEIDSYVASGEPFDKAGGYGIQGLASRFVPRIEGCYFNVVGLPIPLVYEIVKAIALKE
ncbi:MAG: septum formation inhibitor Maf [Acidobacteria bacterium]|nr:MAG: septum formation inhibitor Maf [Acidobacteriota bacterium]